MASSKDDFQKALLKFQNHLNPDELKDFQFTSLQDVRSLVLSIQAKQRTEKRLVNLNRLKRFLEGMEQFGKVIETFLNTNQFVAVVWGPVKFLLQVASNWADAFDTLLDAYEAIGDHIPLLEQFAGLFSDSEPMRRVLALMYEDILEFHQYAVRFFSDKIWKQVLKSVWKTFDTRFKHILAQLSRHKQLIESQATLLHFREYQQDRDRIFREFEKREEAENREKRHEVMKWLCSADNAAEFNRACAARMGSAVTGEWILRHPKVKQWKDDEVPPSPILWMTGIPGAGKTVLASVIIEDCKRQPEFKTSYFFCVEGNDQKDTTVAFLRGLLSQLLDQSSDLLSFCHDKMQASREPTLSQASLDSAKQLHGAFCEKYPNQYIIIDGLDECRPEEQRVIISYLTSLAERSETVDPGKLRVLIVSQDVTEIRKKLSPSIATELKLLPLDNAGDIRSFVQKEVGYLKEKFELEEPRDEEIVQITCLRASGMFLFAKLVMSNLRAQPDQEALDMELDQFPKVLHDVYERIIRRIHVKAKPDSALWKRVILVLGWMTCARRPLRWHEIQAAASIDTDSQEMKFAEKQFRHDIEELCGSLIQRLDGDRLTLVHNTARFHIVRTEYVSELLVQCSLTALCLQYLTFRCFEAERSESDLQKWALRGHFVFQDYAVASWFHHLRAIIESGGAFDPQNSDITKVLKELTIAIDDFLEMYRDSIGDVHSAPAEESCQSIASLPLYESFCMLWSHSQHHLEHNDRNEVSLRQLDEALKRTREVLEGMSKPKETTREVTTTLNEKYGLKRYKCPKVTCFWFHEGFKDFKSRENHVKAHDRPFTCPEPGCLHADMGLKTNKDLEKHTKLYHPTLEDISKSFKTTKTPPAKTPFECGICDKRFTRNFHLRSHLRAHNGEKPYACAECGTAFTRANDCRRHENTVHARKR